VSEEKFYSAEKLQALVCEIFKAYQIPEPDARVCAEVLLSADLRGIDSHGVARLPLYINKLKNKSINPKPEIKVVHELPATALVDGDNGMGPVVAKKSMELAIEKAKKVGAGLVSVRRSNHFGIAGYYSMMALKEGMIGLAMCNAVSSVSPTFGIAPMLGTNPLSLSAPAGELKPFVLDMATSVVPTGKIEEALRRQEKVPLGWLFDQEGKFTDDPLMMLKGGTLAPLGGIRKLGGHKGYGLALMVDILSAVLSDANYGAKQEGLTSMRPEPSNVGHFFMAFQVEGFRPLEEFKKTMDQALQAIKDSPKAPGHNRIYIHGEPEFEAEEQRRKTGIKLHPLVEMSLKNIAQEVGINPEQFLE